MLESHKPKNILITRLSAIGDSLLTIPLAVAAKQLWPGSCVHWAVSCAASQFLQEHPAVDEVIKIPKGWLSSPKAWSVLRSKLKQLQCDLVLDPQGLTKSAMLGWLSGAKLRVGFDRSHGREVAPWCATQRVSRTRRHMVDTYLELLRPWRSIEPSMGQFEMPIYPTAAAVAEAKLEELRLSSSWVAVNPGAGWSTRQWPTDRFAETARRIKSDHGLTSLVFRAGDDEKKMAEQIVASSRGAAKLAPETSLLEMLELLRRCTFLLTGDTGPLHMASSIGTPCVSLHGVTWGEESGPYGNEHRIVQSPILPEAKLQRKGENSSMQAITANSVIAACSDLMSTIRSIPNLHRRAC